MSPRGWSSAIQGDDGSTGSRKMKLHPCATQKLVSRLQNELVHLHHPHGKWFLHHDFVVGRVEFRFHAIQTRNLGPCFHLRFSPHFLPEIVVPIAHHVGCGEPVLAQAAGVLPRTQDQTAAADRCGAIEFGVVVPTVPLEEGSHDCQTRDSPAGIGKALSSFGAGNPAVADHLCRRRFVS